MGLFGGLGRGWKGLRGLMLVLAWGVVGWVASGPGVGVLKGQAPGVAGTSKMAVRVPRTPKATRLPGSLGMVNTNDVGLVLRTSAAVYALNVENIVRILYTNNPTVRAAREEMIAAQHGFEEFRANLSRLEPFVEMRSDLSGFPNRRGAFGNTVESVVGVKKETFEGAVLSTEVGGSFSRFEFDQLSPGVEPVESGGGALVRTRAEMPFFGSRKRQDRIIAQAFQESTARKAQLDYLKVYRSVVDNALEYFTLTAYYLELVEIYQRYMEDLTALLNQSGLKLEDHLRLSSVRGSAETTRNLYEARREEYLNILLSYLALGADDEFRFEPPEYRLSAYATNANDTRQLEALIRQARIHNPAFSVLMDARNNAELQRNRAIRGRYDVTAFLEGTLYPVGSESFDNRFEGWTVGAGINVRLNDRRVLKASRLKAEAQIRQFESEIQAEEILLRRRIVTETRGLLDNDLNRNQILEVIRNTAAEYESRRAEYSAGRINIDQLVQTRGGLASAESNLASTHYGSAGREARLLTATGKVYEIVGMRMDPRSGATVP